MDMIEYTISKFDSNLKIFAHLFANLSYHFKLFTIYCVIFSSQNLISVTYDIDSKPSYMLLALFKLDKFFKPSFLRSAI